METIMKIPFLLSIFAALTTGLVSIIGKKDLNQTCLRMIIAMLCFYLIGLVVKYNISSIVEEQNKIKEEAEKQKLEQEIEQTQIKNGKSEHNQEHLGTTLDLVADNKLDDDGFTPLDLSQAIKTKMMND
jgi:Na+-translocating ferredoxin:NAD+ oxidoreductase RnfG subunit